MFKKMIMIIVFSVLFSCNSDEEATSSLRASETNLHSLDSEILPAPPSSDSDSFDLVGEPCVEITTIPHPEVSQSKACIKVLGKNGDMTELLQYALHVSGQFDRALYLEGDFSISKSLSIKSGTSVIGMDKKNPAKIMVAQTMSHLFNIQKNATNIIFKGFDIVENQPIKDAALLFAGQNKNILFDHIRFIGKDPDGGGDTKAVQSSQDWLDNFTMQDCSIAKFQSGIFMSAPISNINLIRNEFTQWSDYGVYIGQTSGFDRRNQDILIKDNHWHDPAVGIISHPLMLLQSAGDLSIKNVTIINNNVVGAGGGYERGARNTAQGDQVVLQGVTSFLVKGNKISRGGKNALSVSGLSKDGRIVDNTFWNNDQNGLSIGSGPNDTQVATQDDDAGKSVLIPRINNIEIKKNKIFNNGLNVLGQTASSHGVLIFNSDQIKFFDNDVYDINFPEGSQILGVGANNSKMLCFHHNNWEQGNSSFTKSVFLNDTSKLDPDNCGFTAP